MNGDPVHVGVLTNDLVSPSFGSTIAQCDLCARAIWIDPQTCDEIAVRHSHSCLGCAPIEDASEVGTTIGSLRRAFNYLRRN